MVATVPGWRRRRDGDRHGAAIANPGGVTDADDHPRQRQPAARPRARRAVDAGAHRRGRPALRLRARRPHARRRRRVGRRRAARALPHPPAQRPHHRPQRHRHVALDHVLPAPPAARLRPGRHGLARAGDRGHARARHRLPPGPSRRPAVAAVGRGGRVRARHGAAGRGRSGSRRAHRPRAGAPDRRLPGRRGRALRRHRGRHRAVRRASTSSVRGRTCSCTRWCDAT